MRSMRNTEAPYRDFGRAGLLSLLVAVGCSGLPTAPSDSRPPMSSVSHPIDLIGSAAAERACTFGAGYWKAHTDAWPPRFDPAAVFFDSGKSWIDLLRTPPRGDAYYVLSHQFIAAALNLGGIDPALVPPEVGSPFAIAERMFHRGRAYRAHANRTHGWRRCSNISMRAIRACPRVGEPRLAPPNGRRDEQLPCRRAEGVSG